ncbi:adaptin N terminal region-domain-containing protein [Gongronella butleri]|nr:adaptin N terminal region-domain-containing protein [Gongronella butleri]
MFEKSLTDLIRGIRANKKNEQKYITVCLQEIRTEVKANDIDIKAMAVAKLTYLQMLGYDMSWASFHIVEVMSSPRFLCKRTGYLAATQSFQQDTDVLMLTTNLIKKDLASPSPLDISIALNGLSHIVTSDLARDLSQDLVAMLNHSRPYIRKKVVLVLYKVFLKFPEALRLSFPRIREKLEDPDPSVVSAVVGVICELARKNPKNYLALAPQLFKLLTTSSNNWMLIKIIKLFASLTPLEPRLIKKLLPPLTSLIQTTPAMSLLYECIYTVITGGFLEAAGESSHALASTCAKKLRTFLEDPDQNLKYVGLLAMGKLLATHPKLVAEQKDIILECIDDEDISIRLRALDLVVGMVNRKNTMDIVKRLVAHLVPKEPANAASAMHEPASILDPVYRTDIVHRIVFICSQNQYHNITNFEWYISILVGMTHTAGVNVGELLTNQLMDVAVRVKSVREYAVGQMFRLLSDREFLETCKKRDANIDVLTAAAWICGEYCNFLEDVPSTLEWLLTPLGPKFPAKVQAVYIQNIMKIYAYWVGELLHQWNPELQGEFIKVTQVMSDKIDMYTRSTDLEVQERACNVKAIFRLVLDTVQGFVMDHPGHAPAMLDGLTSLFFVYELNPVAPKAQAKVPIPEGLDLDAWINSPLPDLIDDDGDDHDDASSLSAASDHAFVASSSAKKGKKKKSKKHAKRRDSENDEEREKRRAARMEALRNDPYYIMNDKSNGKKKASDALLEEEVDAIPIVQLSIDDLGGAKPAKHHKSRGASKKTRRAASPPPAPPVYAEEEMPENAANSDNDQSDNGDAAVDAAKPASSSDASASKAAAKSKTAKKQQQQAYVKKESRDIFANDDQSGLNDVDLSTPLGEEERFPQIQAYLAPEELRRREEARVRQERKEMRKKAKSSTATSSTGPATDEKKEKKAKKASSGKKKKKSSKKTDALTAADTEITPAESPAAHIVEQVRAELEKEWQQPLTLFEDACVQVTYRLSLVQDTVIAADVPPRVQVDLTLRNLQDALLPKVHLDFAEAFDITLVDTPNDAIAAVTEWFELNAGETVQCQGIFDVSGAIGGARCLRGEICYNEDQEDQDKETKQQRHGFELPLPLNLFILRGVTMDPAQFGELLAEQGHAFEHHEQIKLTVPVTSESAVLLDVSHRAGLHIVEVIPGAASVYAQTVHGDQAVGLMKYLVDDEQDATIVTLDLKATSQALLQDLGNQLTI